MSSPLKWFNNDFLLRHEYFLTDYIYKMGNYDGSLIDTGFFFEGYVDKYNCTSKNSMVKVEMQ